MTIWNESQYYSDPFFTLERKPKDLITFPYFLVKEKYTIGNFGNILHNDLWIVQLIVESKSWQKCEQNHHILFAENTFCKCANFVFQFYLN